MCSVFHTFYIFAREGADRRTFFSFFFTRTSQNLVTTPLSFRQDGYWHFDTDCQERRE